MGLEKSGTCYHGKNSIGNNCSGNHGYNHVVTMATMTRGSSNPVVVTM